MPVWTVQESTCSDISTVSVVVLWLLAVCVATDINVVEHVCIVHFTRSFMKSYEFRGNSAWISCGFSKASMQLTAELQYYFCGAELEYYFCGVCPYFRGMILRCPQICPYLANIFILH